MTPLHLAGACAVMLAFGVNFPVMKIGLTELPPLLLIGLRFGIVALVLAPFFRPNKSQLPWIALLSLTLGSLHFAAMFTGLKSIDGSTAAVAIQIQVPFAALLAAVFFKDKLGWRRACGMVLAFGGVIVLAGEPDAAADPFGLGLVIIAALLWAGSNVVVKKIGDIDPFTLNGWMAVMAAPQLFLASAVFETGHVEILQAVTWRGAGTVLYNSFIVTIMGYGIWYRLLQRYDVNQTVPLTLMVPVIGVFTSVLILDEAMTWRLLVGGALTMVGMAVIVLRRPRVVEPEVRGG